MPSDMSSSKRRVPQRERGSLRVAALLEAAAEVIAEVGCEAATMTEIAKRANASIGTIYQYFSDKDAVVQALRSKYVAEMEARWKPLGEQIMDLSIEDLVDQSVNLLTDFMIERPAYIPLLAARTSYSSDTKARLRLRRRFATQLQKIRRDLSGRTAFHVVDAALQVIKGLDTLYAKAKPSERKELVREFKLVLTAYLSLRLGK